MESYRIWPLDDRDGDDWWVVANSAEEACRLVAINVEEAKAAQNPKLFGCYLDDTKEPPEGLIYCRLRGPITITKV